MPKTNIRQIEAFNSVVQSGSVTKAADGLAVSQPAVTRLIQSFEESCRFQLFNRETGRLVPTAEAMMLYEETSRLADNVARIERVAQSIRNLERGHVTIAAFPGISAQLIPRAIAPFLEKSGEKPTFTLHTRSSDGLEAAMLSRTADFAVSMLPTEHSALFCEPFVPINLICAISRNHPLAERAMIPLEDLSSVPLISLGRNDLSFSVIQAAFARRGLIFRSVAEVQMSESACAIVSASNGVALVTTLSTLSPPDPNFVFRPLAEPIEMMLWLVRGRLTQQSVLAKSFCEAIERELHFVQKLSVQPHHEN
jgi:DNA-binding transcriptional LysR family regulator